MALTRLLCLFVAAALGPRLAAAATLCVNPGGTGGCFSTIQAAVNAAASRDVIQIEAGTYAENVSIGGPGVLSLEGAGIGATIIETGTAVPGIDIAGAQTQVFLSGVSIRNGMGTGLLIDGARVTITGAEISGHQSAGIRTSGRTILAVDSSIIAGNSPGGNGSGIAIGVYGRLRLTRSTLNNNGYAVTTVYPNRPTRMRIEDSTFSGNEVAAVIIKGRIDRSTITQNEIGVGTPSDPPGGRVSISGSILSANSSFSCGVGTRSRGFNYLASECSSLATPRDLVGDDPMVGPLQNNGGPTMTHAPLAGSPVLEALPRGCGNPDQQGTDRLPAPCDIGAYELP